MKRILFSLVIMLFVFSCNQKAPSTSAILTGTISNAIENFATLRLDRDIDTSYFNSDSIFRFEVTLEEGGYYVFSHGHEVTTLFIAPGDSLFLTLNTKMFDETITYTGQGAAKNNYLKERFMDNEKVNMDYQTLYSYSPDSFLLMINATKDRVFSKLEEYKQTEGANIDFYNLEKAKNTLVWANSKFNYQSYHKYFTKSDDLNLDDTWYSFISDIDIQNSTNKTLSEYKSYLQNLINYKAEIRLETDSVLNSRTHNKMAAKLIEANNLISDEKSRNDFLYSLMSEKVKYSSVNDIDKLFAEYAQFCSDSSYVSEIDSLINLWSKLAKGLPAPDFTAEDILGTEYKLSDFRGKYVYVDVWATWCGPCIGEVPFLEKVEEEFADNNIVFLSISVDNKREPWKNYLNKEDSHGLQLYADKAWKSTLATEYMIHSIPRFMLFDKDGKIIDVRAARPSGNIADIIKSLDGI